MKNCKHCLKEFEALRKDKVYCSKKCRNCAWNTANVDKFKLIKTQWYDLNKEKVIEKSKQQYLDNKELRKTQIKARAKIRKKTDINFRLAINLRKRLKIAFNNNQKTGSVTDNLGCTISELKTYLESKFQEGMNWENYGFKGWHIDHIIPLSKFDLSDPKQFKEACHYTNLQPLWWQDNLSKGGKHE